MTNETSTIGNGAARYRLLGRRAVLGGAAATAAAGIASSLGAAAVAAAQDATPAAESGRTTFVLVPGSFAGGWIWDKIVPLLRDAGHDVYAVTLTGLGDRVHLVNPGIDLDTHVTDVVNILEFEDLHDVTLVAHSSGGMVTTGVAERVPERLAQLVYFDALVPADGQSDIDVSLSDADRAEALAYFVTAGWAAGTPGLMPVDAGMEQFAKDLIADPADVEWVLSKWVPHPLAAWTQPLRIDNPAAAALPRAFIYCTESKGTAGEDFTVAAAERVQSDPAWTYLELAANHMVLVNDPEATAEALLALV